MRRFTRLAPLGAVLALAATPAMADPTVTVRIGPELQDKVEDLGAREVNDQIQRLTEVVRNTLNERGALDGATVDLVLTDLKPNKPTLAQLADNPGLDYFHSVSLGGATIEGRITTADGRVEPVKYDWYGDLVNVRDYSTWQDANRAYRRLAVNLADGRFVAR